MKNNVSKRKPRVDVNQIEKQPVDSTGNESMSSKSHRAKPIMPAVVDARMLQSNYSRPQFYFRKDSLEQISLQMNRHIQVLIQTCLLVGQERLKDVVALNHARRLLSEWKRASDICINYQRFFTESILDLEPNITEDSCSVSVFDTPLLRIIPELLLFTETHDCLQSSDVHKLFEKFSPFFEEELLPKLPKYNFFVHTKHSILDAEYIDVEQIKSVVCSEEKWSDAEDALIAKLIREYGSDWLDKYVYFI